LLTCSFHALLIWEYELSLEFSPLDVMVIVIVVENCSSVGFPWNLK
jgi:hypothetical protein